MNLSAKQQLFIDSCLTGKNVFLTGKAGTGKSFVIKEAIRKLKDAGKKVVAVAPTGVAANNIGGQTIHSLFSINPYGVADYETCNFLRTEKRRLLDAVTTIFIDEVSMLRPDILDAINWTLLKNGVMGGLLSKQIIFIGDLAQLQPILNDNTRSVLYQTYQGHKFYDAQCYPKLNVETIELDEVLRQTNEEFITHLNIIREGGKSPYFKKFVGMDYKGIILAPHNATVAKYNKAGLDSLEGKEYVFEANVEGNVKAEEFSIETIVRAKHGAKIMYLRNSPDAPLVNGTIGTFIVDESESRLNFFIDVGGIKYKLERVLFSKKEYVLNKKTNALELEEIGSLNQFPFKLAYALSIHKSQGLTFDEVTLDLTKPCFEKEQMYVALSRVTSPDGLRIII